MDVQALETSWQMWATFGIVIIGVTLYAFEKYSIELISIGIISALLLFFQIFMPESSMQVDARTLLSGFSDPALITVMALLVIGQGIFETGALETPTRKLNTYLNRAPKRTLTLVFFTAFATSMFMNNTPVVVMFIPVLSAMALQLRGNASKFMMPLSFICILAGMTTLIGSSTNILVAGALARSTEETVTFFDPAFPGLILAAIGTIYIVLTSKWLLPNRGPAPGTQSASGRQYIAPIRITASHPLLGAQPVAGLFRDLRMMTVRSIQRGEKQLFPPFESSLKQGDILTVAATRKALTGLLSAYPEYLKGMLSTPGFKEDEGSARMVISEAVIAPGSQMIGKTIEQAGFQREHGCLVLGIQRRSRMMRDRMMKIHLQAGDVLLLFGYVPQIEAMRNHHDILLLDWATQDLPDIRKANIARIIFAGVIVMAAFGILPIVHAAFTGAGLMIATKCLNVGQAIRSLDRKVFLLIGAAFAMGIALEATGGAGYVAAQVVGALQGYGPQVLLAGLFLLVAVMTNLLSNNATALLFAPIAISVSNQTGIDPKILILTVLFAANCSFATPIAYQTNLLVMGPGHYKFGDYVRFGTPLILIIWISYIVLLPFVFNIG
ncbi:MAG: SLC13 family permease [Robiginitomaculum sp.]|nr:MAG: SLC13 family permease [Robiginitomaculum sp.]